MGTGVLVVTGGGRGIGAAIARLGARDGYDVVVNYARDAEAAAGVVAEIEAMGRRAVAVQGEVQREADVARIFAAADALGPLTALVNNAGGNLLHGRVDEIEAERLATMLAMNVTGSMLCAAAAIRRMSSRHGGQGGAIVNISSAASRSGLPGTGVAYGASKGAVDTFTVGLAQEVAGEGIRVNAVRPGMTMTDAMRRMDPEFVAQGLPTIPLGRTAEPEEIAEAAVWLLSDAASYVTGTVLSVTGGRAIQPSP